MSDIKQDVTLELAYESYKVMQNMITDHVHKEYKLSDAIELCAAINAISAASTTAIVILLLNGSGGEAPFCHVQDVIDEAYAGAMSMNEQEYGNFINEYKRLQAA